MHVLAEQKYVGDSECAVYLHFYGLSAYKLQVNFQCIGRVPVHTDTITDSLDNIRKEKSLC